MSSFIFWLCLTLSFSLCLWFLFHHRYLHAFIFYHLNICLCLFRHDCNLHLSLFRLQTGSDGLAVLTKDWLSIEHLRLEVAGLESLLLLSSNLSNLFLSILY